MVVFICGPVVFIHLKRLRRLYITAFRYVITNNIVACTRIYRSFRFAANRSAERTRDPNNCSSDFVSCFSSVGPAIGAGIGSTRRANGSIS